MAAQSPNDQLNALRSEYRRLLAGAETGMRVIERSIHHLLTMPNVDVVGVQILQDAHARMMEIRMDLDVVLSPLRVATMIAFGSLLRNLGQSQYRLNVTVDYIRRKIYLYDMRIEGLMIDVGSWIRLASQERV